jgi:signal transduction histidine kinase
VTNPVWAPGAATLTSARAEDEQPRPMDLAIAAAYAVVFLGATFLAYGVKLVFLPWAGGIGTGSLAIVPQLEVSSRLGIGFVVACSAALVWRRSKPEASFLAICAVGCLQVAIGEPVSVWNIAMPIALFSAAAYASRTFGRLALGIAVVAYFGVWAIEVGLLGRLGSFPNPFDILTSARGAAFVVMFAAMIVIWAVGDQVRSARERQERELERAREIDRQREANARIGALAERHRIARELHDVVAHGLAVMIVQADGALYAEAEHPEAPRQALTTIAATGRESLGEMRRLLGVLRDDPDAAQMAPQPEVASLPALIDRARESGLDVSYDIEGAEVPLPSAVGLTAYRVVQESLTNVLHHAGPTHVEVRLSFRPGFLRISVANAPGAAPPPPPRAGASGGLGLVGMRERVGLLGGRMAAGPMPEGGFRVDVELPTGRVEAQP